jgi:hypothetical protein
MSVLAHVECTVKITCDRLMQQTRMASRPEPDHLIQHPLISSCVYLSAADADVCVGDQGM